MKALLPGLICIVLSAQQAPAPPLTIEQAVDIALRNYPSIRVSEAQIQAAAAGIRLARTAYLPRIDALAQVNRGTRNNIFGQLLPQSVIPSLSGPVIGSNNSGTAFGSALGALVSWEPFDFGLRQANVDAAAATRHQSEAVLKRTQYETAVTVADAFLTFAAAQETVRAAQAGVERADSLVKTTGALVNADLRPGADSSRTEAERAAAQTQLIQAQQVVEVARATLGQFAGQDPAAISISAPRLLKLPDFAPAAALNIEQNPLQMEQMAVVDQAKAQLHALERQYFPKFNLQASAYARGTGAETNGALLGGVNGLAPTVQNFAVGFSVTLPVLDFPSIQARQAAQSATVRAQMARAQQVAIELLGNWNRAVAVLEGARKVAANTPVQAAAARTALQQATARYGAGLSSIDPVAEAQRLLTSAEIDDALARLSVWRGLLGIAAAAGDIQPFLAEASR